MFRIVLNKGKVFGGQGKAFSTTSALFRERSFSHVQVLGRVGVDPQSYGPDVTRRIVFFNVAVNHVTRLRSEDDNFQEKVVTNWHNVAVLKSGLQDYVLQHVSKGARVLCNGRLETRVTPNKEGIPPQKTTNVVLEDIVIMNDPRREERQRDQDYSNTSLEDDREPPL